MKCSRCNAILPLDYEFLTCEKCRFEARLRASQKRAKAHLEKDKTQIEKEKDIEKHLDDLDLNYGLGTREPEKDDNSLIFQFPTKSPDCIIIRRMMLGLDPKDSLLVGLHLENCICCQRLYRAFYYGSVSGVNLWSSPMG